MGGTGHAPPGASQRTNHPVRKSASGNPVVDASGASLPKDPLLAGTGNGTAGVGPLPFEKNPQRHPPKGWLHSYPEFRHHRRLPKESPSQVNVAPGRGTEQPDNDRRNKVLIGIGQDPSSPRRPGSTSGGSWVFSSLESSAEESSAATGGAALSRSTSGNGRSIN